MTKSTRLLYVVVLLLLVGISGCSSGKWNRYELYLGQSYNHGKSVVSAQQWQSFLKTEVTPKFSAGYTVYDAEGFWGSNGSTYFEKSKVLMVVSPAADAEKSIDEIATAYKERFNQDAVLKMVNPVSVEFK